MPHGLCSVLLESSVSLRWCFFFILLQFLFPASSFVCILLAGGWSSEKRDYPRTFLNPTAVFYQKLGWLFVSNLLSVCSVVAKCQLESEFTLYCQSDLLNFLIATCPLLSFTFLLQSTQLCSRGQAKRTYKAEQ